jgi:hypothetical protein
MGRRPATENVFPLLVLVEGHQIVEAAAVERQLFDLALIHQSGNGSGSGVDQGSVSGHGDFFGDRSDLQPQVSDGLLSNRQVDSQTDRRFESVFLSADFLLANRHRDDSVGSPLVGCGSSRGSGIHRLYGDGRSWNSGFRGVHDASGQYAGDLRPSAFRARYKRQ